MFREAGLTAYHINELKTHKRQRIRDDQIRHLALFEHYVVVTKDDDFVRSFVSRKVPEKMIFIYGMNEKGALLKRLADCLDRFCTLLSTHDFIEVNEKEIRLPFS